MHAYEIPAAVKERVVNRMGKLTVNETIDAGRRRGRTVAELSDRDADAGSATPAACRPRRGLRRF